MSWDGDRVDRVDWVDWVDWDGPPSGGRSSDIHTQIERQQQTVEKKIQKLTSASGTHQQSQQTRPETLTMSVWTRRNPDGSSKLQKHEVRTMTEAARVLVRNVGRTRTDPGTGCFSTTVRTVQTYSKTQNSPPDRTGNRRWTRAGCGKRARPFDHVIKTGQSWLGRPSRGPGLRSLLPGPVWC